MAMGMMLPQRRALVIGLEGSGKTSLLAHAVARRSSAYTEATAADAFDHQVAVHPTADIELHEEVPLHGVSWSLSDFSGRQPAL